MKVVNAQDEQSRTAGAAQYTSEKALLFGEFDWNECISIATSGAAFAVRLKVVDYLINLSEGELHSSLITHIEGRYLMSEGHGEGFPEIFTLFDRTLTANPLQGWNGYDLSRSYGCEENDGRRVPIL